MVYYLMLIGAAALFSVQFFFQDKFQESFGTDSKSAAVFSVGTGFGMALLSFFFVGINVKITLFSAIVALVHGAASFLYMLCSLKALKIANLSIFSIFTMLGGMLLPLIYGIGIAGEKLTFGKAVCCALVTVSVLCTANNGKSDKKAIFYYIAVFVTNGMTSVAAAVHQNYPELNVDSYSYMVLSSAALMLIGLAFLPFTAKSSKKITIKQIAHMSGFSLCSGLGNIILMVSLLFLPASLQFPFSTGAAVVFSAIITLLQGKKMQIKEIIAVFIALVSTIFIMF